MIVAVKDIDNEGNAKLKMEEEDKIRGRIFQIKLKDIVIRCENEINTIRSIKKDNFYKMANDILTKLELEMNELSKRYVDNYHNLLIHLDYNVNLYYVSVTMIYKESKYYN